MQTDSFKLHYLLHSATLLEDHLRMRLAALSIHPRQARVIDALSRMEPASQVQLARAFGTKPASMSTMTARLIDAGFITREIDPKEARAHVLRLTDRGRGLLANIHTAWRDIDRLIEDRIGADSAAQLANLTRDLRDSLGGRVPGAVPASTANIDINNS
ncbi:MarR family winged helix-turn-helix transcriptional regulator [Aliiroseovarius sp. F47248L]|uniref:MarR family winged helix-turn-helix transcriptional regulator n=1 Tax=Aliiroseovarius sp. F47248L TaxID=2926420 RepID=UPI001FF6B222|nr:MarR family winged helix-turn-helix transcriptional regulator [Aliiroseovarius sp. F47248L]MCK0138788.1 MarR family winged helix-turn-helix transcriptional regulator [Aliiroseovarius sp. F47248L]